MIWLGYRYIFIWRKQLNRKGGLLFCLVEFLTKKNQKHISKAFFIKLRNIDFILSPSSFLCCFLLIFSNSFVYNIGRLNQTTDSRVFWGNLKLKTFFFRIYSRRFREFSRKEWWTDLSWTLSSSIINVWSEKTTKWSPPSKMIKKF